MAFSIDCLLMDYEFRGLDSGVSRNGKPWRSLRLESPTGRTCEVSTTDEALFPVLEALHKGDVCGFKCRAVAGKERSYIILQEAPFYRTEVD